MERTITVLALMLLSSASACDRTSAATISLNEYNVVVILLRAKHWPARLAICCRRCAVDDGAHILPSLPLGADTLEPEVPGTPSPPDSDLLGRPGWGLLSPLALCIRLSSCFNTIYSYGVLEYGTIF